MRFSSGVLAIASAIPFLPLTHAFHKGFNIGAQEPTGACKTQADWQLNFQTVKNLPGNFRDVRVYASSDCNTLANAVPAAIKEGIQILVGVWTENEDHYNAEKAALLAACKQYGINWISAISVGSEDLYRGDTDASTLANQIYDVRGMMTTVGSSGPYAKWVGHVDTWTAWVNPSNAAVIQAVDFVGVDSYPYFQSSSISNAKSVFYQSIQATQSAVNKYKSGTPLWITETGWPAAGPTMGSAVASKANAQTYWQQVWCTVWPNYASYAYTLRDYYVAPGAPSFGVVDQYFNPIFNLQCP